MPFLSAAYLGSLEDAEITELALHEYKTATNMTEQFASLAALVQKPGEVREEVLADFYNKWQDNYLVRPFAFIITLFLYLSTYFWGAFSDYRVL